MIGNFAIEQTNSVLSWTKLSINPKIIIFGDDEGVPEFCSKHNGIINILDVKKGETGMPLVSDMIQQGYKHCDEYIMYLNSDIILLDDFSETFKSFAIKYPTVKSCLLTAQRYNVKNYHLIDFNNVEWREDVINSFVGEYESPVGVDMFLHKKYNYESIPDFSIARCAFDTWLMDHANNYFEMTVNMTATVKIYHHYGLWYQGNKMMERDWGMLFSNPEFVANYKLMNDNRDKNSYRPSILQCGYKSIYSGYDIIFVKQ